MSARMWQRLGISRVSLEINSLGRAESRAQHREELVNYFSAVKSRLDDDSIRRLAKNPLRILDSKNPDLQDLIEGAPRMLDYLDDESEQHFAELRGLLDAAEVRYSVNPRLVRGLDYYNRTVFEWVTDALGAQGAVCSGGRYDGLVEKVGGRATPAIGWAMGVERLVGLYEACGGEAPPATPEIYIVAVGEAALGGGFGIAEKLRDEFPALGIELNLGGGGFKSQMKRADKSGANWVVVLGDDEMSRAEAGLKSLRNNEQQTSVPFAELAETLATKLRQ